MAPAAFKPMFSCFVMSACCWSVTMEGLPSCLVRSPKTKIASAICKMRPTCSRKADRLLGQCLKAVARFFTVSEASLSRLGWQGGAACSSHEDREEGHRASTP